MTTWWKLKPCIAYNNLSSQFQVIWCKTKPALQAHGLPNPWRRQRTTIERNHTLGCAESALRSRRRCGDSEIVPCHFRQFRPGTRTSFPVVQNVCWKTLGILDQVCFEVVAVSTDSALDDPCEEICFLWWFFFKNTGCAWMGLKWPPTRKDSGIKCTRLPC